MKDQWYKEFAADWGPKIEDVKYNHAGIYIIRLEGAAIYVGKSINMKERILSHLYHIIWHQDELKYQVMYYLLHTGHRLNFDVLYVSKYKQKKKKAEDIAAMERKYISYYMPPLNTFVPDENGIMRRRGVDMDWVHTTLPDFVPPDCSTESNTKDEAREE